MRMVNSAPFDSTASPIFSMKDDLGIVYLIHSAQQFWSELEDTLNLAGDEPPTLSLLDATLRRFIALCAAYHEIYLQSPLQLEHACNLLIESELFEFHSERMVEIIVGDAQTITDPHSGFVFYEILLYYGQHKHDFFRSQKRWHPLMPLMMDHILVEIDPDIEDTYAGTAVGRSTSSFSAVPIPIEAKLRSLCVKLLYEVCKVQTLSVQDLKIFDDSFLDYLFDLVEQTRYMHDETFNYAVIRLIIALNEQFMVVGLGDENIHHKDKVAEPKNRVIRVMMRRLGSCKTLGENMIFMLNRARHTVEDFCIKLLILKILYVLFSTKGTIDYFYTNDLCVLVDVFLRELADLDEESESLRQTYLRVLHPLLTKTQLKDVPYKRLQILVALESMVNISRIREVNPTTKRLVLRCMTGDWCVSLKELRKEAGEHRVGSPSSDASNALSPPGTLGHMSMAVSQHLEVSGAGKGLKSIKYSKSVENLSGRAADQARQSLRSPLDQLRRPSNASVLSLPHLSIPTAASPSSSVKPVVVSPPAKKRSTSAAESAHTQRHSSRDDTEHHYRTHHEHEPGHHDERSDAISPAQRPISPSKPGADVSSNALIQPEPQKRRPPPIPPKRRKPPAIPVGRTHSGATITTIRSSEPSPLSHKTHMGVQQLS